MFYSVCFTRVTAPFVRILDEVWERVLQPWMVLGFFGWCSLHWWVARLTLGIDIEH